MEIKEIRNIVAEMRENILTVYELAGDLRDIFSSLPNEKQSEFKSPCNEIRNLLYEAREQESILRGLINTKL